MEKDFWISLYLKLFLDNWGNSFWQWGDSLSLEQFDVIFKAVSLDPCSSVSEKLFSAECTLVGSVGFLALDPGLFGNICSNEPDRTLGSFKCQ